jgi:nitrite reductase/ring-hydroxylating ferredoxin subunit
MTKRQPTGQELLSGVVSRREMLGRLGYLGLGAAGLALLPGCPGGSTWLPREERERLAREARAADGTGSGAAEMPLELRLAAADYSAAGVHQWSAGVLRGFILKDAAGQWLALSRTCTHSRCPVSWREAESVFHCRCHGSRFNPAGVVLKGPAKRDLPSYPVREEGSELVIDLSGAGPSDIEKPQRSGKAGSAADGTEHEDGDDADKRDDGKGNEDNGSGDDAQAGWNP